MKTHSDMDMGRWSLDQPIRIAESNPDQGSGATLQTVIEDAINRRLATKLGCEPEEVDLMLPSGNEEPVQ